MELPLVWLVAIGLAVPLLGTAIGSAAPLLMRQEPGPTLTKSLLGFASGVMIAAAVWSLLIPAMEMSDAAGTPGWIPASIGFLLGIGFLLIMDSVMPHWHLGADSAEVDSEKLSRSSLLLLSMALHNLPEGMAVGVLFAGVLSGDAAISLAGAFALALGIALQNIPESAVISAPLRAAGLSRARSFGLAFAAGVVEPIGALVAIGIASIATAVLPYFLAFAAGAMIYVVVEDLIPETQSGEHSNAGVIGAALGFVAMMILNSLFG